jgi:hypothetical protein
LANVQDEQRGADVGERAGGAMPRCSILLLHIASL